MTFYNEPCCHVTTIVNRLLLDVGLPTVFIHRHSYYITSFACQVEPINSLTITFRSVASSLAPSGVDGADADDASEVDAVHRPASCIPSRSLRAACLVDNGNLTKLESRRVAHRPLLECWSLSLTPRVSGRSKPPANL